MNPIVAVCIGEGLYDCFPIALVQQPAAVGAAGEAWKEEGDNMEEIMNKRAAG